MDSKVVTFANGARPHRSLNRAIAEWPTASGPAAVSDADQLDTIKAEAAGVAGLKDKLKYRNYTQVLEVHEALESVNEAFNSLDLVPQAF